MEKTTTSLTYQILSIRIYNAIAYASAFPFFKIGHNLIGIVFKMGACVEYVGVYFKFCIVFIEWKNLNFFLNSMHTCILGVIRSHKLGRPEKFMHFFKQIFRSIIPSQIDHGIAWCRILKDSINASKSLMSWPLSYLYGVTNGYINLVNF